MWRLMLAIYLAVAAALLPIQANAHDGNPNNKLVEFENHGAWEIWCIDYGGTGDIRCNLNLVLVYQPRPNFRAMIPRVFYRDNEYRMEINTEWQTSLARGNLHFDETRVFSLSECGTPCVLEGKPLDQVLELMRASQQATIEFHDFLVEEFTIEFPLNGVVEGLHRLAELQRKYDQR